MRLLTHRRKTIKEACQLMADCVHFELGIELDPERIWRCSSTGELFVPVLFRQLFLRYLGDSVVMKALCKDLLTAVKEEEAGDER